MYYICSTVGRVIGKYFVEGVKEVTIEELLKKTQAEIKLGNHSITYDGVKTEWVVTLNRKKDSVVVFSGELELALAILEKMGK